MRRYLLPTGLCLLLILPPLALAARGNIVKIKAAITQNGGPKNARTVTVSTTLSKPGAKHLVVTKRITLNIDRRIKINYKKFKPCPMAILKAGKFKNCPPYSRLGSGGMAVDARPIFKRPMTAQVMAYYSKVGNKPVMALYIPSNLKTYVIPGYISRTSGKYGYKIEFKLARIPTTPTHPDAALQSLVLQIGAVAYSGTTPTPFFSSARCAGAYQVRYDFFFADKSRRSVTAKARC